MRWIMLLVLRVAAVLAGRAAEIHDCAKRGEVARVQATLWGNDACDGA